MIFDMSIPCTSRINMILFPISATVQLYAKIEHAVNNQNLDGDEA